MVAVSAVALATCLATFLLNWSLNLGDKIQQDLRAYGANILITVRGESLPILAGTVELGSIGSHAYLNSSELPKLRDIFWTNQIVAYAPLLPQRVQFHGRDVTLVGTQFGKESSIASLLKTNPYLNLQGRWPETSDEAVAGTGVSVKWGWRIAQEVPLSFEGRSRVFRIVGIVRSGGVEDQQVFANLNVVQQFTNRRDAFKQLLVSSLVTSKNSLYYKYHRNPKSLTSQEWERYSCTPYVTSVAADISKVLSGSEPRILRQISQTEEKVVSKVNWLMILVTLAGLIAASLTMTSTTTGMILERRKELALMKAIGSNNLFIMLYLFAELLLLGTLGSLVGYGLGAFLSVTLSRTIFQSLFELKWIVLPLVCFVGVLIVLTGSIIPLKSAVRLEPAQALKDL